MSWGRGELLAVFGDAEREARDYLHEKLTTAPLAARPEVAGAGVGIGLPGDYDPKNASTKAYLGVSLDGTPVVDYPIRALGSLRLVAWARSRTQAKALAQLALALMLTHPGTGGVLAGCTELTGVQPGRDPDNGAHIASCTVRAKVRAVQL